MRSLAVIAALLAALAGVARAEPIVGAALGAGAQGEATYGALELRLDQSWTGARLGLGVRGVWDDGAFRRADWQSAADAVTIVRDAEIAGELAGARVAAAAGALAPSHVGHLADGYRATLDDRWRTGLRVAAATDDVDATAEIDDVIDPALVAASARWIMARPWGGQLAVAFDPAARAMTGTHVASAIEAGIVHRSDGERARLELGGSIVAEPALGASAIAFADVAAERGGVTWTARADLRAGTGSVGALFGPLYRAERFVLWDRARRGELDGAGAGIAAGAATSAGWLELGVRERPGLGGLVVASAGAPMGRMMQAGGWLAASPHDAAAASEIRIAWAKRLYSALQLAHMIRTETMPIPQWSAVAWFGATSD